MSSNNPLTTPTFFTQTLSLQTVMIHFGWHFLLVGVFRYRPSQTNASKRLAGKRERIFFNFPEIAKKYLPENIIFPIFKRIGLIAVFRTR